MLSWCGLANLRSVQNDDEGPQQFAQQRWQRDVGSTEIILLRHGASQLLVPGEVFPLVNGQGDPPLSAIGAEQASLSADRLKAEPISAVYATTMQRTQQTVAPLAAFLEREISIEGDFTRNSFRGNGKVACFVRKQQKITRFTKRWLDSSVGT